MPIGIFIFIENYSILLISVILGHFYFNYKIIKTLCMEISKGNRFIFTIIFADYFILVLMIFVFTIIEYLLAFLTGISFSILVETDLKTEILISIKGLFFIVIPLFSLSSYLTSKFWKRIVKLSKEYDQKYKKIILKRLILMNLLLIFIFTGYFIKRLLLRI